MVKIKRRGMPFLQISSKKQVEKMWNYRETIKQGQRGA
jgi:hypothetical protein